MRETGLPARDGTTLTLTKSEFLAKVYGLLFLAVVIMAAMGLYTYQSLHLTKGLYYLFLWGPLGVLLLALFTSHVRGLNLVLFLVFALLDGGLLGFIAQAYVRLGLGAIFAQAAVLTLLIFGGLTAYVWITKKDFSYMGTWLFIGLLTLLGASIAALFFTSTTLQWALAVGGTVLFTLYVLYDTSRIINSRGLIDPVMAAWMLFIDLVNLFLYILRLLTLASGDE